MSSKAYAPRSESELLTLFTEIAKYASKYIAEHYKDDTKVVEFVKAPELKKILNLQLPKEGLKMDANLTTLKPHIENVLKYSVRTGSPRYFNQLWSGTDLACVVAEMISSFTNSSTYTYEVAPAYSLMEMELLDHFLKLFGYNDGGDAILTPGGAIANLQGMLCARHHHCPEARLEGCMHTKLVCFTSRHSHYTIKRGANIMGIGMNSARYVPVTSEGKMDPQKLDEMITEAKANGEKPFFVNATSGSTVLGVFEDLNAIADVCEKHNVWMHVDASWGGSVILSEKHKHKIAGIHRADSIAWALHKMLGMNQQCAAFLSKHKLILKQTNASNADYLFHDDDTKPYDLGDKTLNCGRRQDSFKAWLSWQVHGDKGFEERVDKNFENAAYFCGALRKRSKSFELLFEPECTQVCFFCIPPCMQEMPKGDERDALCGQVVRVLRRRVQHDGRLLVNYNPLHASEPNFKFVPNHFRVVFANPEQDPHKDLDFLLDILEDGMKDLTIEEIKACDC